MVSVPRDTVGHELLGFKLKTSISLYYFSFTKRRFSQTTYFNNGPFLGAPELGKFSKEKKFFSELEF